VCQIALSPQKAYETLDSLVRAIYEKLFLDIIETINTRSFGPGDDAGAGASQSGSSDSPKVARRASLAGAAVEGKCIGLLDIFGFEIFVENSFEQLCINYCNERLQTFFNSVVFAAEKAMYSAEGLSSAELDAIEFSDNTGCVRLLDLRGAGIFAQLDEELSLPQGSDAKFCARVYSLFEESPRTRSEFYSRSRTQCTSPSSTSPAQSRTTPRASWRRTKTR
jgi:myosin heavy subunit